MPEFDKLGLEDFYGGQTAETYSTFDRRSRLDPRTTTTLKKPLAYVDARAYSSLNEVVTYFSTTECTVVISTSLSVTANVTVPSTMYLEFLGGGDLSISSGVTVTFPSPANIVASPNQQIFSGAGTVTFSSKGWVEYGWWGAGASVAAATNSTAMQAAIDTACNVRGVPGTYSIATGLTSNSANTDNQIIDHTGIVLTTSADIIPLTFGHTGTGDLDHAQLINYAATTTHGAPTQPGLRIKYVKNGRITVDDITSFHTGIKLDGEVSYSSLEINHLNNSTYNLWIAPGVGEWVTECVFYEGRYNGTLTYHIFIDNSATPTAMNNLRFYNPCFEGTADYAVECQGYYCSFLFPRTEGTWNTDGYPIHFATGSLHNRLVSDYIGAECTDDGTRSRVDTDDKFYRTNRLAARQPYSFTRAGVNAGTNPAMLIADTAAAASNAQVLDLKGYNIGSNNTVNDDYYWKGKGGASYGEYVRFTGYGNYRHSAAKASRNEQYIQEEEVTITAGASKNSSNIIPSGCLIKGVNIRVTEVVTGAVGFTGISIGNSSDADAWGSNISPAANTTTSGADYTITSPIYNTGSATYVKFTAVGANFDGTTGKIRLSICYELSSAPTS